MARKEKIVTRRIIAGFFFLVLLLAWFMRFQNSGNVGGVPVTQDRWTRTSHFMELPATHKDPLAIGALAVGVVLIGFIIWPSKR